MIQPYNPFRPLFYPTVLAVLFGTIYFIYKANPALMDQLALIEKRANVKQVDGYIVSTGPLTLEPKEKFLPSVLGGRTTNAMAYPETLRTEFRFEADSAQLTELQTVDNTWATDDKGIVARTDKGFGVYDTTGKKLWTFADEKQTLPPGPFSITPDFIYFSNGQGDIHCLYRDSGNIAWIRRLFTTTPRQPVIIGDLVLAFTQNEDGTKWSTLKFKLVDGEFKGQLDNINPPAFGHLVFHEADNLMASASIDGLVRVYDLNQSQPVWANTFPNSFPAAPVVSGDRLYLAAKEGQLFATDMSSGRLIWETDLKGQLMTGLTVLPKIQVGVLTDKEHYLHVIDLKTGKRKWRYSLNTGAKDYRFTAIRMTDAAARRLNMPPESNAWTIWGPCADDSICAFDPTMGFLLKKLALPGQVQGWPRFIDGGMDLIQTYVSGKGLKFRKFIEKRKSDKISKPNPETPVDNTPGEI